MDSVSARVFLTVARTGSIGRAAQELYVSTSSVSLRIQALENELGVSLLSRGRGRRTVEITPAGKLFMPLAEQWSLLLHEIDRFKIHHSAAWLRIGSVNSANAYLLPPLYRALSAYQPHITLTVRTYKTPALYAMLDRREIDVAFVYHPRHTPNLRVDPLLIESFVVIRPLSPGTYDPYTGEQIAPDALDPKHEVFMRWGDAYAAWHDKWWNPQGIPRLRVDTCQLVGAFLARPNRWAIVPWSVAMHFTQIQRVGIYRLADDPPLRTCYVVRSIDPPDYVQEGLRWFDKCLNKLLHHYSRHPAFQDSVEFPSLAHPPLTTPMPTE